MYKEPQGVRQNQAIKEDFAKEFIWQSHIQSARRVPEVKVEGKNTHKSKKHRKVGGSCDLGKWITIIRRKNTEVV